MNQAALNYGRASEGQWDDYNNMMGAARSMYGGDGGGGGGGAHGYSAVTGYKPFLAGYSDPFKSYAGYEEFSKTGGYSPEDIANMRARGVSPIRAAYANAEREIGRQRSLQGGYAPNAIAAQSQMARQQGQAAADATQNVEAGLAQARNTGRLAGLGGMSNIEGQRLGADVDISKFNAGMQYQANAANLGAQERAASSRASASGQNSATRLAALQEARLLYGANPGMAETFGNQAISLSGQGGSFGNQLYQNDIAAQGLPGQFDQNMKRFNDIYGTAAKVGAPIYDWYQNRNKNNPWGTPDRPEAIGDRTISTLGRRVR